MLCRLIRADAEFVDTQSSAPATAGDRRARCAACGSTEPLTAIHVDATPAVLETLLCQVHAVRLVHKMQEQIGRMQADHATATMLKGRRLMDGEALSVIREWARERGYPVSSSGGISPRIVAAYRDASPGTPVT